MIITRWRCLARGLLYRIFIIALGGRAGRGLMVDKGVTLRSLPHRGIVIGDNVYLGRGVILDVPRTGYLHVGSRALITHYTVVAASRGISIGDNTQIAEHCSIRDSDHGTDPAATIRSQPLRSDPVTIGHDVWVGRGSAVLRGSTIGDCAVIGANSLVKTSIPAGAVAVGTPARVVARRS